MRLCDFLSTHPDAITARWVERVQGLVPARGLPPLALLDSMPQIIARLGEMLRGGSTAPSLAGLPREHALDRIAKGFDLRSIFEEYSMLRQSILDLWEEEVDGSLAVDEARRLALAVDEAIAETLQLTGAKDAQLLETERSARGAAERDAGEQRGIASVLGAAEERLRLAVEVTGLGTFDWEIASGEFTWSDEARRILGVEPERSINPHFIEDHTWPEDRPLLEAALEKAMNPGGDGRFECDTRIRRDSDGAERWVVARGRVFFDPEQQPRRMVGTVLDITDRKRDAERQRFLSDATAVLASSLDDREIFQSITRLAVPALGDWASVDLLQPDGTIERVAVTHAEDGKGELVKEVARRYPPDPEQATGSRVVIRTGVPELMRHFTGEMVRRLAHNDAHLELMKQMGMESYVCVPMIAHGQVQGAFSIVSTRPGRRYDQADLDLALNLAQRAALNIENARLFRDSKDAAKQREQMLAIVSHDLRNPLNAITVAGALLVKRLSQLPGEERAVRHAEIVDRSSHRMETLIDHLLDVASIQAGRLKLEPKPESPHSLLDEVVQLQSPLASEHGLALSANDGSTPGAMVNADRARLLEVFENLAGNAIKFCQPGDSITLGARDGDGCVVFSVSDTGPGVPEEERAHIFEPYWSRSKRVRGTGLGLFISRGVVEAHGGAIWVESEGGHGTTFFFSVPLSTATLQPRPSIH